MRKLIALCIVAALAYGAYGMLSHAVSLAQATRAQTMAAGYAE